MIRLNQLKLPVNHTEAQLMNKTAQILRIPEAEILEIEIVRQSLDARKKPELFYSYSVNVTVKREQKVYKDAVRRLGKANVALVEKTEYHFPDGGTQPQKHPTVIIGMGPAGLFCAYYLAQHGYAPVILERGEDVDTRQADVEAFWQTGRLKPDSNVQFGEGGAGTFSDGKLNSVVKDPTGRNRYVLRTFVKFGAPSEILYDNKPHIGTDILSKVIANMRTYLEAKGATFLFENQMTDLVIEKGRLKAIVTEKETIPTDVVILALGHSARDTFEMLEQKAIPMEAKNFAVGFRVEHPQKMIDQAMYGEWTGPKLPAAPYKVTSNFPNGRGVYSFCMCPGGYVVNASSEPERTCVNGMSYSGRNAANANSAIIVSVTKDDFGGEDALAGMRYQRMLEHKNYMLGNGKIPQQLFGDYCQNVESSAYGAYASETKGQTVFSNLRGLMSNEMEQSFMQGMAHFAKIVTGFDRADAILSGMETRTSSPVRILRNEHCESMITGIYPCGEGAGYAGGIMSAAIDGLKVATAVMEKYRPL